MRSPQVFVDEYGLRTGGRLFSLYTLALAWYVLAVFAAGLVGIEPLYGQVPPFYAQANAASTIAGVTTAALLLALLAYAALRRAAGAPIARRVRFVILITLGSVLLAVQFAGTLAREGAAFADFWAEFRWQLPVLLVASLATVAALRSFRKVRWWDEELSGKTTWRATIGLVIFSFALAGSVAMIRGGFTGISAAYSRVQYEYIDDIGKGVTLLGLLRDYNELHPLLSMHAKVHPPGPIVMLWIMSSFLFSRDALVLSLGTMAVGSVAILPLFAWVRDMLGQRIALTCCGFYALMPSIVLFTATSADILFMPLIFTTLLLFGRAIHRNSLAYAAGAGVMYALLSLSSFSLLTIGAFFAFVGIWRMANPAARPAVLKTAVVMLASFLLFHAAVRLLTGFDIIECFRLSHAQFTEDQLNLDKVQPRYPSWAFKFFNPLAWIFFAGLPTSLLFLWRLCKPDPQSRSLFAVFALTLLVLTPLYLARGEGERSAIYVLPFLVVPAAHLLDELGKTARSLQPMAMTFLFLLIQSYLIESYLYTYW